MQRKACGAEPETAAIHESAQRGIATASSPLPYAETIQRLFGRHDISGIQAHTGVDAAASARAMGAEAYATGNHVVLGGRTDLHTVAHEAAHVVQQRGGVQLKGGVGEVGDVYERHADQVADAVVRGESAEELLDTVSGGGSREPGVQLIATYGGDWTTEYFTSYVDGVKRGALIKIVFSPNESVISPKIGFSQTLKNTRGQPPAPYYMGVDEREGRANTRQTATTAGTSIAS